MPSDNTSRLSCYGWESPVQKVIFCSLSWTSLPSPLHNRDARVRSPLRCGAGCDHRAPSKRWYQVGARSKWGAVSTSAQRAAASKGCSGMGPGEGSSPFTPPLPTPSRQRLPPNVQLWLRRGMHLLRYAVPLGGPCTSYSQRLAWNTSTGCTSSCDLSCVPSSLYGPCSLLIAACLARCDSACDSSCDFLGFSSCDSGCDDAWWVPPAWRAYP